MDRFGADRIRNTPIIESGVLGAAIGLALEGFKPVVEMQFSDFVSCGMNQIIQILQSRNIDGLLDSISLYVCLMELELTGVHSQSPEGWFMPHAGLKIGSWYRGRRPKPHVFFLFDPNPVLFFEHQNSTEVYELLL